jgi:hypothetical protein
MYDDPDGFYKAIDRFLEDHPAGGAGHRSKPEKPEPKPEKPEPKPEPKPSDAKS